jgi:acyl-homoserine lactone acylase PvdQ
MSAALHLMMRRLHVTLPTGRSGDPARPNFADHLPRWRAAELLRVPLDPARVAAEAETRFVPAVGGA